MVKGKIMNNIPENAYPNVYDIRFYVLDEHGNELLDQDGNIRLFSLNDGIRFKPLEYLCEDLKISDLDEIKGEE
jgi:hypothetical protein